MAQIGLRISVSGLSGSLLIVWKEASAPLAEVGRSAAFAFPYNAVYSITDINPVSHIVQLWRSDDGVSLDQLIVGWTIDASIYSEISADTYQYKVGRGTVVVGPPAWEDPDDTDTELIDERLDGATEDELYVVEAGYGPRANDEYDLRVGGGIVLLDGKTFDQDVRWFITRHKTVAQAVPPTSNQSQFAGVAVITDDRDVFVSGSDNLYNKLVIANKAGSVLTLNFPDLMLIPNHTRISFNTHDGTQKYLKLQFDAGDTVKFFNVAKNVVYLAKCEEISIYFLDGVCYVTSYYGRALHRGSVYADMDSSRHTDTLAYLLADEATGVLNKTDYPGLYEFIEGLPASHAVPLGTLTGQWSHEVIVNAGKINEATTYPNKSKFGIDTVAFTFRVPHLKALSRRFVNTGELPGRYQHDAVGKHEATMTVNKGWAYTGPSNNATHFGNGDPFHAAAGAHTDIKFETGNTESIMKNYGETPYIIL